MIMMLRLSLWLSFFFLFLATVYADFEETYADVVGMAGLDVNSGQNAFLTLLIPSGGKYQSMGTAYTAVVRDSGYLDSNPATSSHLSKGDLTFFHNDWIDDSNLESIAYTQRTGNLGWGMGGKFLWVPFNATDTAGATYASAAYSETVVTLNGALNFLNDYYYSGLSLGVNFKAAYRNVPVELLESYDERRRQRDPDAANTGDQSAVALMADVGLLTRFNFLKGYASREKNFALGVSVKNLGKELIDRNSDPLPSSVSAGFSYSPVRPLLIAFDTTLPFNLNGEAAEQINYAVGLDLNLTDFLSFQSGFLIKVGKPRVTAGTKLELERFALGVNYVLDLATQFKPVDRIVLSLSLNLGDFGRTTLRDKVQELYLEGLAAYSRGEYVLSISKWEECLELDDGFTPAREMIETTEKSIELEQTMREKQTVE